MQRRELHELHTCGDAVVVATVQNTTAQDLWPLSLMSIGQIV